MTDSKALARPPQVTMAGWVTIVGSVMVVLGMYDAVANLRTLETQERVSDMLKEPPLKGTGLAVEEWLEVLNVVFLLGAACAAAAGILGWFVMQRSHASRIGLSIVAVPLFVTGLFSGAFTTSLIAVSAVLLWTRPARDWFNGIAPPPPTPTRSRTESAPPVAGPESRPPESAPPVAGPESMPPPWPPAYPPPQAGPHQAVPHQGFGTPYATPVGPPRRPTSVLYACLATWIASGVVGGLTGLTFLALAVDPGLVETMREQDQAVAELGMSDGELRTMVLVGLGLMALWSAAAMLLAIFAFRRHNWARICLIVSASMSVVFALTGAQLLLPLLPAGAAVAATYFLLRSDAREWYRSKGRRSR